MCTNLKKKYLLVVASISVLMYPLHEYGTDKAVSIEEYEKQKAVESYVAVMPEGEESNILCEKQNEAIFLSRQRFSYALNF